MAQLVKVKKAENIPVLSGRLVEYNLLCCFFLFSEKCVCVYGGGGGEEWETGNNIHYLFFEGLGCVYEGVGFAVVQSPNPVLVYYNLGVEIQLWNIQYTIQN